MTDPAHLSIAELIRQQAKRVPDAAALLTVNGATLTWQGLNEQSERTRNALSAHGLGHGDRVALVLRNGPSLGAAFLTIAAHATCAPLNPAYTAEEFEFYLRTSKARALITASDVLGPAADVASRLGLKVLRLEAFSEAGAFALSAGPAGERKAEQASGPESIGLVLHTSGTTGSPKLVPLTHRALLHSARSIAAGLDLSPQDRCLNVMPLFHIHGLVGGLLAPLMAGGSSVCAPKFDAGAFFLWIEQTRPTWYTAVPTMHHAVVTASKDLGDLTGVRSLRFVRSCSASLAPSLLHDIERVFEAPVLEAYGMTEAAHQISTNPLALRKPGTVGVPSGVEVGIVDGEGAPLAPDEVGEVVIRGPSVLDGYDDDPAANARSFFGAWFRTGDLGRLDSDGYLTLVGRLKEQINRGGQKISPLEIDHAAMSHPEVSEAVTFGVPHPTLGEDVAVAVVLQPAAKASAADLEMFLRQRLATFKVPRRIHFLDAIPKGPTGKVQRKHVANTVASLAACSAGVGGHQSLTSLERQLIDVWKTYLPGFSMSVDDDFFEQGGDSLAAVRMLLDVEQIVGHPVSEATLMEAPTIRRLARSLSEVSGRVPKPVIRVRENDRGSTLFFFHGDRTEAGFYTRRLADLIGPEHGLTVVAPHGLHGEPVPSSIEEMAAERLPSLLAAQTSGPFRLGGHCVGGLVAFEVARLLMDAGHRVELVAMVDAPLFNARPIIRVVRRGLGRARKLLGAAGRRRSQRVSYALDVAWLWASKAETLRRTEAGLRRTRVVSSLTRRVVGESVPRNGGFSPVRKPEFESGGELFGADVSKKNESEGKYLNVLRKYNPEPLTVPVLYFSAEYDGGPLRTLTTEGKVHSVPGGHLGCLSTHMEFWANHLRTELTALDAVSRGPA